mgnify:CR=1 FL=1
MNDDKSTPLTSLNNKNDDSEVVNNILKNYDNLQNNPEGSLPPIDSNIQKMEQEFEDRDMNNSLYNMNSDNTQFKEHSDNEARRLQKMNNNNQVQDEYENDNDEYDEYEVEELPLWKKIVNEIRVPLFIFIMILAIMSATFDKKIIKTVPLFGDQYNEINTYGFIIKAFICSLLAYILVRFIRV